MPEKVLRPGQDKDLFVTKTGRASTAKIGKASTLYGKVGKSSTLPIFITGAKILIIAAYGS